MSEVTTVSPSPLASFIERAAVNPDFDVNKFGELLRMQKDVEHDQARKAFNRAMAAAQADMLPIVRDAKNSHLNNRYAKLETIDAAIRPIYTTHGFSVRYGSAPSPHEGWMRITCTVAHEGGYFEENYLDAPVSTTGSQGGRMAVTPVQAIGSTVTYLRRYLLGMVWNAVLADEDDDDGEGTRVRSVAASTPRAPRLAEKPPPNGNGITASSLMNRFTTTTSRAEHLAIVDDPDVAKALDWLKANRQATYTAVEATMVASWKRTEPPIAPTTIENDQELEPVEIEGERYGAG